jgi:hypothetical protein
MKSCTYLNVLLKITARQHMIKNLSVKWELAKVNMKTISYVPRKYNDFFS